MMWISNICYLPCMTNACFIRINKVLLMKRVVFGGLITGDINPRKSFNGQTKHSSLEDQALT